MLKYRLTCGIVLMIYITLNITSGFASPDPLKSDEVLRLFPTYATWSSSGHWETKVRGWVFEPEHDSVSRKLMIKAIGKGMDLSSSHPNWPIFRERIRWFLVDNERSKTVQIKCLDAVGMGTTKANGQFLTSLKITAPALTSVTGAPKIETMKSAPTVDGRVTQGVVFLVPPEGLSVISDIDDTVKLTEVLDRDKMLNNTFVKPFQALPGMADLYQRWAKSGAMFHFISSSPWQLQPLLADFLKESGFPAATFHLKLVRLKDRSLLNLFKPGTETKPPQIKQILNDFPQRHFILVGDSGEHDPEVYGIIARQYQAQIKHIYIREVSGAKNTPLRFQEAFRDVPTELWTTFSEVKKISASTD